VGHFAILKDAVKRPYPRIRSLFGVVKLALALGSLIGAYIASGWWATAFAFLVVAAILRRASAVMAQSELTIQRELTDDRQLKLLFQFAPAHAPYDPLSATMGVQTRSALFNVVNVGTRPCRLRAFLCSRTVRGLESTGYPEGDLALRMQSPTGEVVAVEPGSTKRVDLAYVWPGVGWLGFLNPDNSGPYELLKIDSTGGVVTGTVRVVDDDTGESTMVRFLLETDPAHDVQLKSEQFSTVVLG